MFLGVFSETFGFSHAKRLAWNFASSFGEGKILFPSLTLFESSGFLLGNLVINLGDKDSKVSLLFLFKPVWFLGKIAPFENGFSGFSHLALGLGLSLAPLLDSWVYGGMLSRHTSGFGVSPHL